jgi:hypothetical protein
MMSDLLSVGPGRFAPAGLLQEIGGDSLCRSLTDRIRPLISPIVGGISG